MCRSQASAEPAAAPLALSIEAHVPAETLTVLREGFWRVVHDGCEHGVAGILQSGSSSCWCPFRSSSTEKVGAGVVGGVCDMCSSSPASASTFTYAANSVSFLVCRCRVLALARQSSSNKSSSASLHDGLPARSTRRLRRNQHPLPRHGRHAN